MCELMGLCFARPVRADFSIRPFALRAVENADGWGLAWYPDRSLSMVKEPLGWGQSGYAKFLESYPCLESCIYLAHVRKRTVGGQPTHADTHPFAREMGGREYCFAHNGTLVGACTALSPGRYKPLGQTDSEHAFCHLLDAIAGRWGSLDPPEAWPWLHSRLTQLNPMGQLNCMLSDGQRLICYRDAQGWKGMTLREVGVYDHNVRPLEDPGMKVSLESTTPTRGVIVATNPLDATPWRALKAGEMVVLEQGAIRFSSRTAAAATAAANV